MTYNHREFSIAVRASIWIWLVLAIANSIYDIFATNIPAVDEAVAFILIFWWAGCRSFRATKLLATLVKSMENCWNRFTVSPTH